MRSPGESSLRVVLGVTAGAAVAAAGALLLGEYTFTGAPIFAGGVLLGFFVAEAVVSVGRRRGPQVGAVSAVLAAAGLTWAAWISSGRDLNELPGEGWIVVAVGAMAAAIMAAWPSREDRTRSVPSETD